MAVYKSNQVGYYIHHSYDNYTKYGLLPKSRVVNNFDKPATILGTLLNEEKQKVIGKFYKSDKNKIIQKIETDMNYYLGQGLLTSDIQTEKYANSIVEHLVKTFGIDFTDSDIDWKTLTLSSSGIKKLESKKWNPQDFDLSISTLKHSRAGKTSANNKTNIESIKKQIMEIKKACAKLTVSKKGKYSIQTLSQRLNALDTAVATLKGRVNVLAQSDLNLSAQDFLQKATTASGKQITFIDEIRKIAQIIFAGSIQSVVEGELLEAFIANWDLLFQETFSSGMQEIGQAIGEVLGSTEGTIRYDTKNFMKDFDLGEILGKNYQKKVDNGVIAYDFHKGVKGKADARISLVDGNNLVFNAKSYNLDAPNPHIQNISLVSETSLLYLFQNRARFLNHYLNQTVETAPNNTRVAANHIMRQMLTLVAMSGGGIRSDSTSELRSNVMVINNKSSKQRPLRVVPVDWLYSQFIKYYNQLEISLPKDQSWPNKKANEDLGPSFDGAIQRIGNLLMAIKTHHISVQVPQATVKKILSYY